MDLVSYDFAQATLKKHRKKINQKLILWKDKTFSKSLARLANLTEKSEIFNGRNEWGIVTTEVMAKRLIK